jgi:hypothetical protein
MGRTDQYAYKWGDQILTPNETLPKYATEDDVPEDYVTADKSDAPNDVDGDHTHPDKGGVPKTPEEGDIQKSLDRKMSQTINLTFQTETSAGMTKNQLVEPAGQKPKTTVNSAPTAKTDKSEVEKKEAEPPEVSKPAKVKSERPTDPPDPNMTTNAAPPTEVTGKASMETTLTPTAAMKNPAEDKPEEAKEKAVDEPMETFTKPIEGDTPATDTLPPTVASEDSPRLEPGGHKPASKDIVTTYVATQEQNRKIPKNNQAAQVQETYSKVDAPLTDDDDASTERAVTFNPDPIRAISDDTKEPTDKLPMTAMAWDKIHILANVANNMMPSDHNFVKNDMRSNDPPLNISRSKGEQGRQLEALTEGVHDVHYQKSTLPNIEITSPVNTTSKSIVIGEQNHGVKAIMFDEAYKGDGSKPYNEADNDNVSSKSATEVTVMMHNTTTLKSTHSLKATVKIEDKNEEPPEEHNAKTANTMKADII